MGKSFKTAAAFRASLEERLKTMAAASVAPINSLRLKLVIERLLARLFATADPHWLVKGGYAMERRYRPRARTTKDIDLSVKSVGGELGARIRGIREELQVAADRDLGDYFQFQIGEPSSELQGAPDGGARFPVHAVLAGRTFAKFHVDVGFGDPLFSAPEELSGQNFLEFAGDPESSAICRKGSRLYISVVEPHEHAHQRFGRPLAVCHRRPTKSRRDPSSGGGDLSRAILIRFPKCCRRHRKSGKPHLRRWRRRRNSRPLI